MNRLHNINGNTEARESDSQSVQEALRQAIEAPRHSVEADLTRLMAATLLQIHNALTKLDERVSQLHTQIETPAVRKEWYSVAEAAAELGKAEFTVREWARHNRINAHKRECGRGGKREWMISQTEIDRIRNKGLLPAQF